MTTAIRLFSVFGLALVASQPATADPKADAMDSHARLLAPIQIDSLAVIPIVSTDTTNKDPELLVLDEAMPKKLVQIAEIDSGDVNQLSLSNRADQPLFLLAGEVIIGGKQDRIIGSNTIIPAKTTQSVPVFCVEHGRWDGKTTEFTTANALAHGKLRGRANYDDQEAVWAEVADKNEARKTKTSTDTYRHVAEQQADKKTKSWQDQFDAAIAKLDAGDRDHLVGFAVALNGKIATIDRFGSPRLFAKLRGKLERSYITEALDVPVAKDAKPATSADVKAFIADADKAKTEAAYETAAATSEVQRGHLAAKARVDYKPAPPPTSTTKTKKGDPAPTPAPAATAADEAVYENYQQR